MTDHHHADHALIELCETAGVLADIARGVVGDVSVQMPHATRLRKIRRARMESVTLVDQGVYAVLAAGATWEEVAEGLGDTPDAVRRRYQQPWEHSRERADAHGSLSDRVASLDSWYQRHAEPWEGPVPDPVANAALVEGQATPGDPEGV